MDIGKKIKQMRNQKGLTQNELADRCELTKGYISQLENNVNSPSIATLTDILVALGSNLAEFFKVLGDTTRAKILSCLEVRDLYVGEIAGILNMSISAVSHQLRVLRNAKLVKGVKEGKEVKYSLDDNHIMMIMECGMSHIKE